VASAPHERPAPLFAPVPDALPPGDDREALLDRFVAALVAEWEGERIRLGIERLETVFVGGGTPSLLGWERIERLLEPLEPLLTPRAEITLEANPDDVSDTFAAWAAGRRLRVSLGVQSFDARLRAELGRRALADPETAFAALRRAGVGAAVAPAPDSGARGAATWRSGAAARRPGAPGLGIDLIFGLPGQRLSDVEDELAVVARLRPDHVSWYELGIVSGSALAARVMPGASAASRAAAELPDDETASEMFRRIVTGLGRLGYEWYEVSNFAQPGRRCGHNSAIWRGHDYLGIGPGAVGTAAGVRRRDVPDAAAWLGALEGGREPAREHEELDDATRARERLLLAARTGERVPLADLAGAIDEGALPALAGAGLVSLTGGTLRVTRKGRYVANGVCVRLFRDSSFLEA
jgi:oxygen-independent coproporphyrinogen-3 oxidase